MATSRPSSRNLSAKPASKSQGDCKRNGEAHEKEKKRSTSSRQSQNHDLPSHESQSQKSQSQKSQSHESQSQKSQSHESQSQKSQRHESSSQKNNGCLEILTSESSLPEILKPVSIDRPTSGNRAKKAPSINRINSSSSEPRRTPTPTKQIILEAAKRKTEPTALPFEETVFRTRQKDDRVKEAGQRSTKVVVRTKEDEKKEKDDDDGDDDDEDDEESSSEEEAIKAPNELMMEFLDCVLKEDYVNGLKLCTMILLYEPENAEALSFKSLIEEKMAFDVSNQDDSEEDDEDDEDDDDEDDSSEDDSNSSESSIDEEEEEEEGEEEEKENKAQTKTKTSGVKTIFVP